MKGRRCENQGLGIGAFVYYRRVVESHKDQIFDEIIKVAKKVSPDLVAALEVGKAEHQFLSALDLVKAAMPQSLLIGGNNPLTLLHSALSEGLHAKTDKHCLELAQAVRVVLADLAERIGQALKDEAELSAAVARLTKSRSGNTRPPPTPWPAAVPWAGRRSRPRSRYFSISPAAVSCARMSSYRRLSNEPLIIFNSVGSLISISPGLAHGPQHEQILALGRRPRPGLR